MNPHKENVMAEEIRILKKGSCPTLSGKSTLSYVIGCNEKNEVFMRIAGNTGGGFHSGEWVSVKAIGAALAETPDAITSLALFKLFKGKSVNTPAFLLAALKHEGVVAAVKGRTRRHTLVDLDRLGTVPTPKKAAVKKKATPRKRATR